MPTGFSKGLPLRFHLNLPTDKEDEDMEDRVRAIRAEERQPERLTHERLANGPPVPNAKMEAILERMRRVTEEMARL